MSVANYLSIIQILIAHTYIARKKTKQNIARRLQYISLNHEAITHNSKPDLHVTKGTPTGKPINWSCPKYIY